MRHIPWVSFDGKDCSGCKYLNERGYCSFAACIIPCTARATIPEAKPQTNGDRFRNMSDEELADWIVAIIAQETIYSARKVPTPDYAIEMRQRWLEWLRQECAE